MAKQKVVGLLGGGQLGRMFIEPANRRNIQVNVLDAANSPAKQISSHSGHVDGSFSDAAAIRQLAKTCDVLTIEIEHVDTIALPELLSEVAIEPSPSTIKLIQNKYHQKQHLQKNKIPVADFREVKENTEAELKSIGEEFGYPFMLKAQTQAYDGKGNYPVKSEKYISTALMMLPGRPLYAERWSSFQKELAVMVVKTKDGVLSYPTVETVHEDSICKLVFAPARDVSPEVSSRAQQLARDAIATFSGKGVFGVEMFLVPSTSPSTPPTILINEIAPRPHNSGHYTIEACASSQFDAHLRAILDIPLPPENLRIDKPSIMLNILGGSSPDSHFDIARQAEKIPRASIHLYGKESAKPGRKMGHITVTGETMLDCEKAIKPLVDAVDKVRASRTDIPKSDMPSFQPSRSSPLVGVCMGSESDKKKVDPGLAILKKLNIPFEARVTSAHRTPDHMRAYAMSAASRGIRVIIGAAGGAAHLPGMMASWTTLPVIGLPIAGSHMDGIDSYLSMAQMPRGEPVLTVGIDNAVNAALGAARILGAYDPQIAEAVKKHFEEAAEAAIESDRKMQQEG